MSAQAARVIALLSRMSEGDRARCLDAIGSLFGGAMSVTDSVTLSNAERQKRYRERNAARNGAVTESNADPSRASDGSLLSDLSFPKDSPDLSKDPDLSVGVTIEPRVTESVTQIRSVTALPANVSFPFDLHEARNAYRDAIHRSTGRRYGIQPTGEQGEAFEEAIRVHAVDGAGKPWPSKVRMAWVREQAFAFGEFIAAKTRAKDEDLEFWAPSPKCWLRWLNECEANAVAEAVK